ncbi:MAG: L-2-hydroxyglutarate oxidase [Thermodesulfobacteriota bacterium]
MSTHSAQSCNILIVGAGITGLATARELAKRGVGDVLILEKEERLGAHASGRNSGVLHAGIYYSPGTNKARFCVEGNRLMKEYCRERGLTLKETGKVIVPDSDEKEEMLAELKRRADSSGARCSVIDPKELLEIEPYAAPGRRAIYSPDTAVVDPAEILNEMRRELEAGGKVRFLLRASFLGLKETHTAVTSAGDIRFGKLVNAAGTFADKVAAAFGVGGDYKVLPFKGTYKKLKKEKAYLVKGNIYPVPDLRNPFLGVHFTRSVRDEVYIGPTAIPVFGREEYGFLDDLSLESLSILFRDGVLFFANDAFRYAALTEIRKYSARNLIEEARGLLPSVGIGDVEDTPKRGIRPQLVDWRTKELVTDFVVVREGDSLHILNAISPAFTCSLAFARHTVDMLLG